jgi:hypothetical protein
LPRETVKTHESPQSGHITYCVMWNIGFWLLLKRRDEKSQKWSGKKFRPRIENGWITVENLWQVSDS